MPIRFDGQVAIVTGAGNGMGRDYALTLGRLGASVVVNDVGGDALGVGKSRSDADAVVDEIRSKGGKAVPSYENVATREGGLAIAKTALDAFGHIDALIHNAGITRPVMFADMTEKDFDETLRTHLYGGFFVAQPCFREMRKNGYGRIVLISSGGAFYAMPTTAAYAAAKGGLQSLMNVIAVEGAEHGILCNAVLPAANTRLARAAAGDNARPGETGMGHEADLAFATLARTLTTEFVTPMTLFLSSRGCTRTNMTFSAVGGRYSSSFTGRTKGWVVPEDAAPSVDDIAAHLSEIEDKTGFLVPEDLTEEICQTAAVVREGRARARV